MSSTVKDLVAGSGIPFDERGAVELKGIPGEWRLFAVAQPIDAPSADAARRDCATLCATTRLGSSRCRPATRPPRKSSPGSVS